MQSDKSCHKVCDYIGHEMRARICKVIIENGSKISVLIDEATSINKKSNLIVYIKTCFSDSLEPVTFYLDLIELPEQNAECIYTTLIQCLEVHGFTKELLSQRLIGFASDGASVMFGSHSGVAKRVQQSFPNVILWYCFNHRLELAVGDAVAEISGTNHFKILFDKLYHIYHSSAKNKRELEECCQELSEQFFTVGRVLDNRWVASSFRTVKVIWNLYYPLHCHLTKGSEDPSRNPSEKQTFKGLATKLASSSFVLNLATMYDCLEELSSLSLDLQERKITLPRAHALIFRAIRVFNSMVDYPGIKYKEIKCLVDKVGTERKFKGVLIQDNRKRDVVIPYGQLMRSLAANLEKRLVAFRGTENDLSRLINSITVLNPSNWPKECPLTCGGEEIKFMCDVFHLDDAVARRGFQEYIDNVRTEGLLEPPEKLVDLIKATKTIAVSTAECERGFSQMNILASTVRSSLTIKTLSTLMFIKCVGPPPQEFCPTLYARSWKGSASDNSKACARKRKVDEEHDYNIIWKKLKT